MFYYIIENNIPNCESIVINKISNKIFFPTKFNDLETGLFFFLIFFYRQLIIN